LNTKCAIQALKKKNGGKCQAAMLRPSRHFRDFIYRQMVANATNDECEELKKEFLKKV